MKIMVKEVGKPLAVVDCDERYFTDCVQKYIGKTRVEKVYLNGADFIMGVDENGYMKELPVNFYLRTKSITYPIQGIAGTVVFVRCKPCTFQMLEEEIYDLEVSDVTDEDIHIVECYLDKDYQDWCRFIKSYTDDDNQDCAVKKGE